MPAASNGSLAKRARKHLPRIIPFSFNSPQGLATVTPVWVWARCRASVPVVGLLGSLMEPAGHLKQLLVATFQ
jgi:hypothetical protein